MKTHVVHWSYDSSKVITEDIKSGHLHYLKSLATEQTLIEAGAFPDGTGALLVFRVDSEQDLHLLLAGDPYVEHEIVATTKIYEWQPVLGPLAA